MSKVKQVAAALTVLVMAANTGVYADPPRGGGHSSGRPGGGARPGRGGHYIGHSYSQPRFGFYFGYSWLPRPYYPYYPYYSYHPYYPYYPPAIVTIPADPPVYIERGAPQSPQQPTAGYWYYCTNPEGYYPYVKECPGGWQQVEPIPPQ